MNILFATSEATPFAKTGGLADVCGALPAALARMGHRVSIFLPAYSDIEKTGVPIESTGKMIVVPLGKKGNAYGEILKSHLPGSGVSIYFIRHDDYYKRDGLYNSKGVDYQDNCERFIFFSRAVLEAIHQLDLNVDIIHANDWQTGLVSAYLELLYKSESKFRDDSFGSELDDTTEPVRTDDFYDRAALYYNEIRTVFTIHNLRHQGRFGSWDMDLTGFGWKCFTYDKMEFYNQLNLLKTGIIFSDAITTVSPKYAEEIQTEEYGERLQGVLRFRSDSLSGILNGIDTDEWNPATDSHLSAPYVNFNSANVFEKKPLCKAALQEEFGLPAMNNLPLLGVVSRFDHQKGLDLVADIIPMTVQKYNAQFAILGTGEPALEERFRMLARQFPENVSVRLAFSNELSHRVEAGSDLFLMPSRYEPCGLNQMYSHRYGTLPIVRPTGGLADTIVSASDETIADKTATGFVCYHATAEDMLKSVEWAMFCYLKRPEDWKSMVTTVMQKDWSWTQSALRYSELYQSLR